MRMIPKNTKITSKVWKSYSLLDMLIALALFVVATSILMSNLPNKFPLLIVFCTLSVALMFGSQDGIRLYMEIGQMFKFLAVPKKFSKEHKKNTIDKLVPYTGFRDDGTIEYGDYYGKVISVGSLEFRLLDEWVQNNKITLLARIINNLTVDQSMQIVKLDQPITFDQISKALFEKLERKSRKQDPVRDEILRNRISRIDDLNHYEKQYRPFYYFVIYDSDAQSLNTTVEMALSVLNDIGLEAHSLSLKETVVFLKYTNTRNFDERGVDNIEPKDYLEYVKPGYVKFGTSSSIINETEAFSYVISEYPLNVTNAWGAALFNINNTKVVLNIKPLDREKATKRVDRAFGEVASQILGKASQIVSQTTHMETMATLLQNMENENESMFDCSLIITAYKNDDEVTESVLRKQIRQRIVTGGFRTNSLFCRQMEAYISTNITRHNALKRYERGINSESLAAVFPFVFTTIIDTNGIALGVNSLGYPVILDPNKRSGKFNNSNIMVIGKPGGGKSFFAKAMLANMYSENTKSFVLDPENEYSMLADSVNGTVIDVGNALKGRLNPFHIFDILTDTGEPAPPETIYSAHLVFLESFFKSILPGIHPDSLELLNNLVTECYEQKGIYPETICSYMQPDRFPIFDDLLKLLREKLASETNPMLKSNYQRSETYITKFASGGRNSHLWNGPSTLTSNDKFTVFNFQSLLANKNNVVANGQMLLMLRFLEQQVINAREENRSSKDVLRPIVVLDEGYLFVNPEFPVMLDFVYQWFKRIRKYNGIMIMITQNVQDLVGNAVVASKTSTILSNTQYHFIFPLAPGDVNDLTQVYKGAGDINETEQYEIANNGRGTAFLISAPGERTSFTVVASEYIESLFLESSAKAA